MSPNSLIHTVSRLADDGRVNPPGLTLLRRHTESALEAMVYQPVVCLILQGRKVTTAGTQRVQVGPGDALLVSHDLPVVSRITRATAREPYLALVLTLDLELLRSLHGQLADERLPLAPARSLAAGRAESSWVQPLERYVALVDAPMDAVVLGPSILREIHYRLLLSSLGGMLRRLLLVDSHASRISRAIQRLRAEYRSELSVASLARTAGMSASSFHHHFKAVTGTTPLQYQKDLRLIEARMLLSGHGRSVSETAYDVGYESPSHFSRDYRRKFGRPPRHHTGHSSPVATLAMVMDGQDQHTGRA